MFTMLRYWSFSLALFLTVVVSQSPSSSLCFWLGARGGVVRDTLYIEGGMQGLKTIVSGRPLVSAPSAGLAQFNFSSSFDQTTNFTDLFQTKKILQDPLLKTHVGGFMFADVDEWYSFGGQASIIASNLSVDTGIIRDALYDPYYQAANPSLGISTNIKPNTNNSTTFYITGGAGVSVPSESLGFYFGGLHSRNFSHLSYFPNANGTDAPSVLSKSMLRVNTKSFGISDWSEIPLPSTVTSRAEAVLAWVPIGRQGAVVVIGGVPYPSSLVTSTCALNDTMTALNNAEAPAHMSSLPVYDVASGAWYSQSTNGPTPSQLASACAVVASSPDNSVHNIHVYGGYNGVDKTSFSDDVWILSIPSFTWIKVPSTDPSHGRVNPICAKPYPDQMMVIGGVTSCNECLRTNAFADVFNLSSLTWTGSYDPAKWSEYAVPSVVSNAIKASPTASMDDGLLAMFKTPYPGTVPKYYPYTTSKNPTTSAPAPSGSSEGSSYLKWLIPVIVVAALLLLGIVGTLGWCNRRRKRQATLQGNRSRRSIIQWIRGQPVLEKSVKSDDETTQVNSPYGVHEATGDLYFRKPVARNFAAELNSDSNQDSMFGSQLGSPRGPISPSSRGTAELYTPASRHELASEHQDGLLDGRYDGNHLTRLSSMGDYNTDGQTGRVSSMTTDRNAVYELPQNRSDENIVPHAANNAVAGQSKALAPSITFTSPGMEATSITGQISPDITSADISPNQEPVDTPVTPLQKSVDDGRPTHTRNISSLSSGLPDLGSPSAYEDQRRSMQIAALPDLPHGGESNVDARKDAQNNISSASPTAGDRSVDGDLSPILQQSSGLGIMSHGAQRTVKILRRKELPSSSQIHERVAPSQDKKQEKDSDDL